MKKILFMLLILMAFVSCTSDKPVKMQSVDDGLTYEDESMDSAKTEVFHDEKKLFIYNWAYYIPKDVITEFEKLYGIEVVYYIFTSNENMFENIQNPENYYDIAFPSGDYVSILANNDLIEKIDKTKIENFKNIDKEILNKIIFDKNNNYSIPYMIGATGIAVNKKFVTDYKKDMSIFERSDLKGKMTLLKDMREVLGHALKYLGYSVNTTSEKELNEAKQLVLKWKENIVAFDAETFSQLFAKEELYVVHGYSENIFLSLKEEQKENIDFFLPENGGPMYIDSMVILKKSTNKELAYKFINYIHKPEVYAKIADYLQLPSLNTEAKLLTKIQPKYTVENLAKFEIKENLGIMLGAFERTWAEILKKAK